jgi:predicted permease
VTVFGGVLGMLLAWLSLPALQYLNPNPALSAFLAHLELDGSTLAFAAALVLGTGLVAGLLPSWQARSVSLVEALRSESRGASLSRSALRSQQMMVVLQAGVSVLILAGAGLAGLTFYKLGRVPLGFVTAGRAVMQVQFPEPAYATHEKRAELVRALEQNLAGEPVLRGWGVCTTLPVGDSAWGGQFVPQLATGEFAAEPALFHFRRVSPGYLAAMGVPLLDGRMIDDHDRADSPLVMVVSKALAEKYWPGQSALGRKLHRSYPANAPIIEVVGVVGDVHDAGAGLPAGETVYVPFAQASLRRTWVVLSGRGSLEDTIAAGRRALRATAPDIAAYNIASLDDLAWQAEALARLQMTLLGVFALIAVVITALGSYGVMSQLVANREKEIAIRAALGASQGGVLRLVLWQNARLAGAGSLLGVVAAWFGGHALGAYLTDFDGSPVWPYLAVVLVVVSITQVASFIPASRASRLDVPKTLA